MILFANNNTKYLQTKKNKNIKNQRMWAIIEDFIQILIILNTVAVLSCAQERKWMALRRNTMSSCVNTYNDLHTQMEEMSAPMMT